MVSIAANVASPAEKEFRMPTDQALSRAVTKTTVTEVRRPILEALVPALDRLVTTPGVYVEPKILDALRHTLESYEELVRAGHTSSHISYAFRDTGADNELYERAKHLLGVCDALFGPKAG